MIDFDLNNVRKANSVVSKIARKTLLNYSPYISTTNKIYLKTENLQLTGSFKLRGAYYKISTLSDSNKQKGIIACSAGNHAQGVALSAKEHKIKATIFIPSIAPLSKIEATRSYGVDVRLIDGVYDDAYTEAIKFQKETGGTFIHPFDDINVIEGQATIALEILEQLKDIDAVVVPIGGGGLISGIAATIKSLKPKCKVYGVQAQNAPSMYDSIKNNKRVHLNLVNTFADGTAVKFPGELTFDFCKKYVDDIFVVSENEITSAILVLMEKEKMVVEGAGALSVAACLADKIPIKNKNVVCILSGGNIDFDMLSGVLTRALLISYRISYLNIDAIDKPGEFNRITSIIAKEGVNIVEIMRVYDATNIPLNSCRLRIVLETKNFKHLKIIKEKLVSNGYHVELDIQQ